jgi:TolA-binding protein
MAKINFAKSFSYPEASVAAHYYLGKIYAAEKYTGGAIKELSAFIEKAPDGNQKKDAERLLAKLTNTNGDAAEAEETASAPPARFEPVIPESSYAMMELRIDSLLTMEVADTLTDPGRAMLTGVTEFQEGKFDNAIKEFKRVMAAYPTAAIAAPCSYNIGICYLKLRLFKNADNQFDNLCNRSPRHPLAAQALFLKAFSLFERGNSNQAERGFREFIQKYRNHSWASKAWEKLGDVYEDVKQFTKAMDAYTQAAAAATDCSDRAYAYFKLGNVCMEAGNPQRGVVAYKKNIELGESKRCFARVPDSYYKIADYQYRQKDLKNALETYQKVARKYPGFQETPWGLFQMGNIHKSMRNYRKAAETYKELLKRYPDDYWAKQAQWKLDDAMWENEYQTVLH